MRWNPGRRSENLEDRRGEGGRRMRMPGGGFGKLGLGGIVVLLVLSLVFKQDFLSMAGGGGDGGPLAALPGEGPPAATTPEEEKLVDFVSFVLDDAQGVWARLLPAEGTRYEDARLVLFRDAVESACGFAESATGPFYCPGDRKVYVDLGFYEELQRRFGAPGDFAQAYVLAHEIGHHVQNLLGIEQEVRRAQRGDPARANDLSVRMELQADCLAGIWASTTAERQLLERGDLEEGLGAAAAVGDDRIQRMSTGRVSPDGFTHGTSAQRMEWFRRGLQGGRVASCDTFAGGGPR